MTDFDGDELKQIMKTPIETMMGDGSKCTQFMHWFEGKSTTCLCGKTTKEAKKKSKRVINSNK